MKLETWLRMTRLPYSVASPPDLARAPKGKLPFIEHEGRVVGDSNLVIEDLRVRHGVDPDAHLDAASRATSLAFRRLLDENFYWVLIEVRWRNPEAWAVVREAAAASLPEAIPLPQRLAIVEEQLRPSVIAQQHGHGMGRHSAEEIHAIGIADMGAVADFLGAKRYFFGDRPSTADATVYAYLANLLDAPVENPVRDWARARPNLRDYVTRMKAEYFPEL